MSFHINKGNDLFKMYKNSRIFVDKSMLIKECNSLLYSEDSYMCVTRPRRFGKTMALSMLNAYYSKGCDSKEIFEDLNISKDESYLSHLNKHNVIFFDMAGLYTKIENKDDFVKELKKYLIKDLKELFPSIDYTDLTLGEAFVEITSTLNETFVFLIDEWDVLLREEKDNYNLINDYMMLLRNLFKSSNVSCSFDLVYMTGILPIRHGTSQSDLNNFREYSMSDLYSLDTELGFTEEDVKELCLKHNDDFNQYKYLFDGYTLNNKHIYNPLDIAWSIPYKKCYPYWSETASRENLCDTIKYDNCNHIDTILRLIFGKEVRVDLRSFESDLNKIKNFDASLSLLVHYGYLSYNEKTETCRITNNEIRELFVLALEDSHIDIITKPLLNSVEMIEETLKCNYIYINDVFDRYHKELKNIFKDKEYDDLGIIVQTLYYKARKFYNVSSTYDHKEKTTTVCFVPRDNTHLPFIIEIKTDDNADKDIEQIMSKEYFDALSDYHGKVMLIGINYDSKLLKHDTKIEIVEI